MATESAKSAQSESAGPEGEPSNGKGFNLLQVGGIIGVVVVVECVLAYFLIPSPSDLQSAELAAVLEQEDEVETLSEASDDSEVEVDLGEFVIVSFQSGSATSLRIDFQLIGIVDQQDEAEVMELFERCKNRLRDKVLITIRSSEMEDLSDAGLALIKRRILERTNAALGKPLVRRVIFSRFSCVEQ